jgi:hypothetical protein
MNVKDAEADINDLHSVRTSLTCEYFLLNTSSDATLKLVLNRGPVPHFQGGLASRLSLLFDILTGAAHHA